MPIHTSLNSRTSTPTGRRPIRRSSQASRLCLESLEDRCLLSFSPAVSYPVGATPLAVVTGDFNGDGKLDLAEANELSNTVSVLTGKGDGSFQAAQDFATGSSPQSLVAGDFNGDGRLDLVTTNADGVNDVSVLLGNGNGSFQAPRNLTVPGQFPPGYTGSTALPQTILSVTVGDLNGDGKLDLAVGGLTVFNELTGTGYYGNYYTTHLDGYVNVLLGNGDASFTAKAANHLNHEGAYGTALGDFNGDGKLDVAATAGGGFLTTLLGNGDGTLQMPLSSSVGEYPVSGRSMPVADFNHDGKPDLLMQDGTSNSLVVMLGNGDGTFRGTAPVFVGNVQSAVVGDVNADGKLDVVLPNSNYLGYYTDWNSSARVLLGNGDGSFAPPTTSQLGAPPPGNYSRSAALGDFNGDGRPDLAGTAASGSGAPGYVVVALNDGVWTSSPQASSLTVSGFPSPDTAGVAGGFTLTARTSSGAAATGYTGTVHFTSSDGQAGLPADYTFAAADAGVHTFSATLKTAGTQSITATDTTTASLTGGEVNITVNAAAASHLDAGAPAGSTAGNAFSLVLTARDPYNNIAGGYRGTVHFTSTDGQAGLPGNYTFTAADAGLHAFHSGVILKTAGSQTVTATDTITAAVTGNASVAVSPAAARTLTVAGFPSPITAGVAGSFTVSLKDPYGNIARGYTGTVRFTSSDGKAALPAKYTFTAADAGVHTFRATLKTAGTQSITARDTTNVALSGSEGSITVRPAAAGKFLISAPAGVRSGVPFGLTLTVQDGYGNAVTGYTGTIRFTSTDGRASLPASHTSTGASMGVHTFTGLVLRKKGVQKITLADTRTGSLSGSVTERVL